MNTVIRNLAQTEAVWLYPPDRVAVRAVRRLRSPSRRGAAPRVPPGRRGGSPMSSPLGRCPRRCAARVRAHPRRAAGTVRHHRPQRAAHWCRAGWRDAHVPRGSATSARWMLGFLGVALVSVKPHIAIAFGVGVIGYLLPKGDWRALGVATVALLCVTLPAELRDLRSRLRNWLPGGGDRPGIRTSRRSARPRAISRRQRPHGRSSASIAVAAAIAAV